MGFKMALGKQCKVVYLSFKNMKLFLWLPFLFIYVIIPLTDYFNRNIHGLDVAYSQFTINIERFIPFFAVWWIILILREYIEGEGNEVLYVYENLKRTKIFDILFVFIIYAISITPLFIFYGFIYDNMVYYLFKTIIQSLFFVSFSYFLMYLTKSAAISFMMVLLYHIIFSFITGSAGGSLDYISVYNYSDSRFCAANYFDNYLHVIALSILFLLTGMLKNKSFYK